MSEQEPTKESNSLSVIQQAIDNPSKIVAFPTKEEIQQAGAIQIRRAMDGEFDPLDMLGALKSIKKYVEEIEEGLKQHDIAWDEAQKYPEKNIFRKNLKFQKTVVYTKYDFEVCNDPEWNELNAKLIDITEKIKERETTLKTFKKPQNIISDDGEVVTVNPPIKRQTDGLKVFFN